MKNRACGTSSIIRKYKMTEQQLKFDEGHFQDRCLLSRNLFFSTCCVYFALRYINEKTVENTYMHMVL